MRTRCGNACALVLLSLLWPVAVFAQTKAYVVPLVGHTMTAQDFVFRDPADPGHPPSPDLATTVRVSLDTNYLVIRWSCTQAKVPFTRDKNFARDLQGDYVRLDVAPYGSDQEIMYFALSAFNDAATGDSRDVQIPLQWSGNAIKQGTKYLAVMSIPLDTLGISSSTGGRLAFTLRRYIGATDSFLTLQETISSETLGTPITWPRLLIPATGPRFRGNVTPSALATAAPRFIVSQFVKAGQTPAIDATGLQSAKSSIDLQYPIGYAGWSVQVAQNPDASNFQADQALIAPDVAFPDDWCNATLNADCRYFFARNFGHFGIPFNASSLGYNDGYAQEHFLRKKDIMQLNTYVFGAPVKVFRLNDPFWSSTVGLFDHGERISDDFATTKGSNAIERMIDVMGFGGPNYDLKGHAFDDLAFSYRTDQNAGDAAVNSWFSYTDANHVGSPHQGLWEIGTRSFDARLHAGYMVDYQSAFQAGVNSFTGLLSFATEQNTFRHLMNIGWRDIGPKLVPLDGQPVSLTDARGPIALEHFELLQHKHEPKTPVSESWSDFFHEVRLTAYGDRLNDGSGAVRTADLTEVVELTNPFKTRLAFQTHNGTLRTYQVGYPAYIGGLTLPDAQSTVKIAYDEDTLNDPNTNPAFTIDTPNYVGGAAWTTFGKTLTCTGALTGCGGVFSHQNGLYVVGQNLGSRAGKPTVFPLYLRLDYSTTHWNPLDRIFRNADGQTVRAITLGTHVTGTRLLGNLQTYIFAGYDDVNGNGPLSQIPFRPLNYMTGHRIIGMLDMRWGPGYFHQLVVEFGDPNAGDTVHRWALKYMLGAYQQPDEP